MTLEEARKIVAAAEKKAVEIKQPMNVAVVDEGGNLVSHVRMDGAWIGSIDISGSFSAFMPPSRSNNDLRWRHSAEARRKSRWRGGCKRRIWRAGSYCGASRG